MRAAHLVLMLLASPALGLELGQIESACYANCEQATHSNPEYKACLARAADTADGLLNDLFKILQESVRSAAKAMDAVEAKPNIQLDMLKDAQRKWIEFRDASCSFEDSLAFGGTATGGYASSCICAMSYERINDFARIKRSVLGE